MDKLTALKEAFNGGYLEYAGGTLALRVNGSLELFNVPDKKEDLGSHTEEETAWVCLNYIRHKSPQYSCFDDAVKYVEGRPEYSKELAIALLKDSDIN